MLSNPPPGSAEWLNARKNGIGASETAAILGLSRYKSAVDVYIDKTKEIISPRPDSAASKRGRRLEPIVLDMYEEQYGAIHRNPPQVTSKQYPFMFASLDAARVDDGRPVEAKTAGKFVAFQWGEAETDDIPAGISHSGHAPSHRRRQGSCRSSCPAYARRLPQIHHRR